VCGACAHRVPAALPAAAQDVYFSNKTLYAANKMVPSLDNMDQRIADDTRNSTTGLFALLFGDPNGDPGMLPVRAARSCPRPRDQRALCVYVEGGDVGVLLRA
jgi:hypothetical protein